MLINKDISSLFLIDIQVKLTPFIYNSDQLITRCVWLQTLAKTLGVATFITEQYPAGLGPTIPQLNPQDFVESRIEKTAFSCMESQAFHELLKKTSTKQCVLAGIEAHVCVLQTALQMRNAGLEVFIVADAVGSRNPLDYKFALQRMRQENIHIVTAEMVFFEWIRDSTFPAFKSLSKQFLQ